MILVIDNYDSFVYNLVQYVGTINPDVMVVRNRDRSVQEIAGLNPEAIIISPGPCTPDEAGISVDVVQNLSDRIPILGVCLGHQSIGQAFGCSIVRGNQPVHGKTSEVYHLGEGLYHGIPSPLQATRYHSLVIDRQTIGPEFIIDGWTDDGTVMSIRHRERPLYGLQYHPESIMTIHGMSLIRNFLEIAHDASILLA